MEVDATSIAQSEAIRRDPTYLWREVIKETIREVIKEAIRRTCGGLNDLRARARASAPPPPQGKRPD